MADPKSIHEFLTGEADNGTLFLVDTPDQQAQSGYTTEKLPITDIGDFINNELQYTQDLDTEDKTVSGAINELHDSIGADVYSTNTSYTAGMYCIYNNTLYRCKDSTSGAWDSSKWEAKTITSLIESKLNKSKLHYGVGVTFDNNGVCTIDITSWGLSTRPDNVFTTGCWAESSIITYDRTNSTAKSLKFYCYDSLNNARRTGTNPFTYLVIE